MNEDTAQNDDVIADTFAASQINALTAAIVSAFVSNNHIAVDEMPRLIKLVRQGLANEPQESKTATAETVEKATSAQIKKSITPDALICFEDGKSYKSLKRHLRSHYNLTPEQYKAKWGLPHDYPMVAPNYSAARSALAKTMGLGQQQRTAGRGAIETPEVEKAAPKKSRSKPKPEAAENSEAA